MKLIFIVDKIMKRKVKLNCDELYQVVNQFSSYQNLDPNKKRINLSESKNKRLLNGFVKIVRENREGI